MPAPFDVYTSDDPQVTARILQSDLYIGLVTDHYAQDARSQAEYELAHTAGKPILFLVVTPTRVPAGWVTAAVLDTGTVRHVADPVQAAHVVQQWVDEHPKE